MVDMINISSHEIILTIEEVLLRDRFVLSEYMFGLTMTN